MQILVLAIFFFHFPLNMRILTEVLIGLDISYNSFCIKSLLHINKSLNYAAFKLKPNNRFHGYSLSMKNTMHQAKSRNPKERVKKKGAVLI